MNSEQNLNEATVGGSELNVELDDMMYKPQQGEWKLIAPDGTVFVGDSPLRCVKAEIDYRVPAHVQLQRLLDGIDAIDEDAEYTHDWDDSGERCLKCGDKDWFAASTCKGK